MERIVAVNTYGGGLGNLLFMHHAAYTLAKRLGPNTQLWMSADYVDKKRPNIIQYAKLFQHVRLVSQSDINKPDFEHYVEHQFPYSPIPPPQNGKIVIHGYFQSFKFMDNCTKEIRNLLWSNERDKFQAAVRKHTQLHSSYVTVCTHIRRGDYLGLQHYHPVSSANYYVQSIKYVVSKLGVGVGVPIRLVVFSDDIPFVQQWAEVFNVCKNYPNVSIYYEHEEDPLLAVMLMSLCDHFIIANSSLSLNGYYLRKDKAENALICAPANWFGPQGPHYNLADLVPPSAFIAA